MDHLRKEPLLEDSGIEEVSPTEPWHARGNLSIFRALVVLMNTIIGCGLLGIPYCFRSGIVLELIVLCFFGSASHMSFLFLIDCSFTAGHAIDFGIFMRDAFEGNLDWIPQLIMFVTFGGFGILHLQSAGSLLQSCLRHWKKVPTWCHEQRWFYVGIPGLLVGIPLILFRSIRSFSHISTLTCGLIVVYVIHSGVYFILYYQDQGFDPDHKLTEFKYSSIFLESLSIQAFAYACHALIGPTLEKLEKNSIRRQYITMTLLTIFASLCYGLGGLLPYLTLFDKVQDPIVFVWYTKTATKHVTNAAITFSIVTELFYSIFLLFTTPLILYSARLYFNDMVFKTEFTPLRWNVVGVTIILCTVGISIAVKSIQMAFDFVGGITCNMIVYMIPAVYYIRICKGKSRVKTAIAWIMIPIGFISIGVCLYDAVSKMLHK